MRQQPRPSLPLFSPTTGVQPLVDRLEGALRRVRALSRTDLRAGGQHIHDDIRRTLDVELPRIRWDDRILSEYEERVSERVASRTYVGDRIRLLVPVDGESSLLLTRYPEMHGQTIGVATLEGRRRVVLTYWNPHTMSPPIREAIPADEALLREFEKQMHTWVVRYQRQAVDKFEAAWSKRVQEHLEASALVESLGIPLVRRRDADETLPVPIQRKVLAVAHPPPAPTSARQIEQSWYLPDEDFRSIVRVIERMGLVIERSPRAFSQMDEEDVRWHILVQLNGQFEWTATGETFSCTGKTDVQITYEGRCVFIAECKFWRGPKSVARALDQLLGYLAWRDTRAALVVFVRDHGFTKIIERIEAAVQEHPNCAGPLSRESETSTRWRFRRSDEPGRGIELAVLPLYVPGPLAPALGSESE